jgi:hypothetical protein
MRLVRRDHSKRMRGTRAHLGAFTVAEQSATVENLVECRDALVSSDRPECLEERHLLAQVGAAQRLALEHRMQALQCTAVPLSSNGLEGGDANVAMLIVDGRFQHLHRAR